ncbi:hypothetical protein ACLK1V_19720 [Escherichia coli]
MAMAIAKEQQDNAIFSAKTPVMDALWANRPHTLIDASGLGSRFCLTVRWVTPK